MQAVGEPVIHWFGDAAISVTAESEPRRLGLPRISPISHPILDRRAPV